MSGAIGSSDRLIKDTKILATFLLKAARQVLAVEMESAGVYRGASGRQVPSVAIRGISDVVGFKRHPGWTGYACHSAAAFTHAFLRTRPIGPRATTPPTEVEPERGERDWVEELGDSPETFFNEPSRRKNLSAPWNQVRPSRGSPRGQLQISDEDVYGMLRINSGDYAIAPEQMIWIKQKMSPPVRATVSTSRDAFVALRLCEIVLTVEAARWPAHLGRSVLRGNLHRAVVVALALLSNNPDDEMLTAVASKAIEKAVERQWLDSEAVDNWNSGLADPDRSQNAVPAAP